MIWNRNKSSLSIIDLYVTLQKKNNLIAYILSLAMDIPTEKRRTEEVDFKKCNICQTDTTEALVKNISIDAYKNILFYVCSRVVIKLHLLTQNPCTPPYKTPVISLSFLYPLPCLSLAHFICINDIN